MEQLTNILSWICLISGSFFALVGGIGMLKMPDVYTRSPAAGITDTLGALLILVGLMFQAGFTLITVKLFFILVSCFLRARRRHTLNHTAWANGLRPKMKDEPPVSQPGMANGKD